MAGGREVTVHRAPVLIPAPQGWRGVRTVRERRIAVEDGALVLRDGARCSVLAGRGEVTRMLLVDPPVALGLVPPRKRAVNGLLVDTHGVALVVAGDRPVLAVRVGEWLPCPERKLADVDARRVSGIDALAGALGVPLEYGDAAAVAPYTGQARGVLVETLPRLPRGFAFASWCALLAFASMFFVSPSRLDRGDEVAQAVVVGLLVVATVRAVVSAALRLDAVRQQRWPPEIAGGVVVRPVPAPGTTVARVFERKSALYLSDDVFVVVAPGGQEAWLPGPGCGGVRRANVNGRFVIFDDSSGTGLACVLIESWAGTREALDDLRQRLTTLGVQVRDEPGDRHPGALFAGPVASAGIDTSMLALQDVRDARGLPFFGETLTFAALPATLLVPAPLGAVCAGLLGLSLACAATLAARSWWDAKMIPVPDRSAVS